MPLGGGDEADRTVAVLVVVPPDQAFGPTARRRQVEAMLALRLNHANGEWEAYWRGLEQQAA